MIARMHRGQDDGSTRALALARSQTRRKLRLAAYAALLGLAWLLFFAIAGTRSPGESPVWVYWVLGGAGALGLWCIAGYYVHRARPRAPRHVTPRLLAPEARRGDRVPVGLTISGTLPAGAAVEVGLVCTQIYEVHMNRRTHTEELVAHEEWSVADPRQAYQEIALPVPPGAPFSYQGKVLSYAWQAQARQRHPGRPDSSTISPLWVRP